MLKYYKFDTISGGCACCTKSYNEKVLVPEEFIKTIHEVHKLCEQLVEEFYEHSKDRDLDRKDYWPNTYRPKYIYQVETHYYLLDKYEREEYEDPKNKEKYIESILALNEENQIELHLIQDTKTKEFRISLEIADGYHSSYKTVIAPDLSFNSIKPLILQAYNDLINVITKNQHLN